MNATELLPEPSSAKQMQALVAPAGAHTTSSKNRKTLSTSPSPDAGATRLGTVAGLAGGVQTAGGTAKNCTVAVSTPEPRTLAAKLNV
jgi:hypothetical protein